MHRFLALLTLWGLCLTLSWTCVCADQVILLNHEQIIQANVNGLDIGQPGAYTGWAWSKDASYLQIAVEGQEREIQPGDPSPENAYSWKKLGEFNIPEAKTISIRFITDKSADYFDPSAAGWAALSLDPDWNPGDWFDLCKVHPNKAEVSDDKRLGILRSKDHFYPFPHYRSKYEWLLRKQYLKDHLLMSMGCAPMPPRTPLHPVTTGRVEYDDYVIENVYFESMPGFLVTGNLYRPKGKRGPFPAVLCPHGHWGEGILTNTDNNSVPGRCINFARQGYIAFAIDMIGYNNNRQLTHKFGGPAEWLWGLSLHGLQFWNSVRAIDYLCSLDDVDADRIAVTGASGGGTQTYGIMAVDERVKAAAPVNMLSSHFQGGCLCENAANLRIDLNNVELGAMMAPRPLMMVSCTGDWTAETLRVEYPAIRSIYELYEKPENVGVIQIDAGHNYNRPSREAVYRWFGRWILGDDNPDHFTEQPFPVEPDKMKVFPDGLPDIALGEEAIVESWKEMSEKQLQSIFPEDERSLSALRRRAGKALRHALGVENPDPNALVVERIDAKKKGDLFVEKIMLGREGVGDRIPAILLAPDNYAGGGTLLVHCDGKDVWFDPNTGKPGEILQSLLDRGQTVLMVDVFMTGEYNSPFQQARRETDIPHFLTYNQSETALRVQDVLTALAYLQSRYEASRVNLIGGGYAGMWCLLAAAIADDLQSAVIDAAGFEDSGDADFMERLYAP
ncbi:MAG: acetylxylan esterase, partial [Candidatus Omnitrophica bacterium]|nr:acetylxylan esterase [Candidatus Omnitrophota bacterium]